MTCYKVLHKLQTQNMTWCLNVIIMLNFEISSAHTQYLAYALCVSFLDICVFVLLFFSKSKWAGNVIQPYLSLYFNHSATIWNTEVPGNLICLAFLFKKYVLTTLHNSCTSCCINESKVSHLDIQEGNINKSSHTILIM